MTKICKCGHEMTQHNWVLVKNPKHPQGEWQGDSNCFDFNGSYCACKKFSAQTKLEKKRIANRKWQENNKEKKRALDKKYYLENQEKRLKYKKEKYQEDKEKHKIYNRLGWLKRKGVIKLEKCEKCNSKEDLIMHHEDYSKPLQINVLCRSCHNKHHNLK